MHPVLEKLTLSLSRLPGVGKRSAMRMAQFLITQPEQNRNLRAALEYAEQHLVPCSRCGNITDRSSDPCRICCNPNREGTKLCLVEMPSDIELIEATGNYQGHYFCLMGKLSPMHREDIADEKIKKLLHEIQSRKIKEIILALNNEVESDATAHFLKEMLAPWPIRITRLAMGIPAGSGIQYVDPITLGRAFQGRQDII